MKGETPIGDGSVRPAEDGAAGLEHAPTHSPDGVDLTLLRWFLSLTPAERLQALERTLRSLDRLRALRRR